MFQQITGFIDILLSPVTVFYPCLALALVSAVFTILVFMLNRLIVKKEALENIKRKMTEIRENLTLAQQSKNVEAVEKWMKELVEVSNQYLKNTSKSMILSIAVFILIIPWVGMKYSGEVVKLPFSIPYIGNGVSGIYWYIIVSFVIGMILNKILGV